MAGEIFPGSARRCEGQQRKGPVRRLLGMTKTRKHGSSGAETFQMQKVTSSQDGKGDRISPGLTAFFRKQICKLHRASPTRISFRKLRSSSEQNWRKAGYSCV